MKEKKKNYWLNSPEVVADVLSHQVVPKDGMMHTVAFVFSDGSFDAIESAFVYLQSQGREIIDIKPYALTATMFMIIIYK